MSERSHSFRPDIQALRALAVGLVLIWHAGVPGLPAGFIGVDIFFVVSGFLITGLLLAERGEWGAISLRGFYARRARRLLPAATIVTIATLVATVLIMPSLRQESIALDGLASTFYVENWRLADQAVDYQAAQVATSPFQHYWSLSVEEQFYLVWPLLLLVVLSGHSGFFRSGRYRGRLLAVLGLVFVASLGYSIWDSYTSPDPAYFVTVNRVWQFAAGGILAAVEVGIGRLERRSIALPLAAAGLASLIAGALLIDPASPYPGLAALVPTFGTVALLAGGTVAVTTTIGRHLTSRPVLRVGDLSYSLYLWHWPMLVFAAELFGPLSATEGLLVVALAFVPSIVTERLVERPIRLGPRFAPWRAGLALGGVLMLASTVVALGVARSAPTLQAPDEDSPFALATEELGVPDEEGTVAEDGSLVDGGEDETTATEPEAATASSDPLRAFGAETLLDDAGDPLPDPVVEYEYDELFPSPGTEYTTPQFRCRTSVESSEIVRDCNREAGPSRPRIALVGDSHALQWVPIAHEAAARNDWSIDFYLKAACALNASAGDPSCRSWGSAVQESLAADPPDLVLVTASDPWVSEGERSRLAQGFAEAWQPLRDAGSQLVVLNDTPRPDKDIRECVFDNASSLIDCAYDRTEGLRSGESLRSAMQDVDELLDLNDLVCPIDPCPAVVGRVVVFRDTNHLSQEYVRTLRRPFDQRLQELVGQVQGA